MNSRTFWSVIGFTSLALLVFSIATIGLLGINEESIRILIRWSAKLAAVLFGFAFVASAFHYFSKSKRSARLLKSRAAIGLAFGTVHLFHLGTLLWLQKAAHPVFSLAADISLIGGGLAYLFLICMMVTTHPVGKKIISPRTWKQLHTIGGYWLLFIFTRSYVIQVQVKGTGYVILAFLIGVLILRLLYQIKKRREKTYHQLQ